MASSIIKAKLISPNKTFTLNADGVKTWKQLLKSLAYAFNSSLTLANDEYIVVNYLMIDSRALFPKIINEFRKNINDDYYYGINLDGGNFEIRACQPYSGQYSQIFFNKNNNTQTTTDLSEIVPANTKSIIINYSIYKGMVSN